MNDIGFKIKMSFSCRFKIFCIKVMTQRNTYSYLRIQKMSYDIFVNCNCVDTRWQ